MCRELDQPPPLVHFWLQPCRTPHAVSCNVTWLDLGHTGAYARTNRDTPATSGSSKHTMGVSELNEHPLYKRGVAGPKMATGSNHFKELYKLSCSIPVSLSFMECSNSTKHTKKTPRNHFDLLIVKKQRQTRSTRVHGVFSILPSQNSKGLRAVESRQLIEFLDDIQRLLLDRLWHPQNTPITILKCVIYNIAPCSCP